MRINELREKIDKLGQKYDEEFIIEEHKYCNDESYIKVYVNYSGRHYSIARIELDERYSFSTIEEVFDELLEELQEELFEIFVEFARTPADEREEEKKYQYQLKEKYWWMIARDCDRKRVYINLKTYRDTSKEVFLESSENVGSFKTEFTDEEIEEVVKEFDVDLEMFDKIEVLDD